MADETLRGSPFELAWAIWARRKWLGVMVFAAAFSAVASVVVFLPDIYKATATVLVEREQAPELARSAVIGEVETRLQTISQQILSRARLQELINLFDLYPDLRKETSPEAVIERMRHDIHLERKGVEQSGGPRATVAFALSYQGREPQRVALIANTLASFYIEENWKSRGRQATETAEFFKVQLEEMRKRLEEQEHKLKAVQGRHPDQLPLQAQANLVTFDRLNTQLRLNMERLTRVMERRESLTKQLGEVLPYGSLGPPGVRNERVSKLKQELRELRTRYSDKYPDVVRVREEIAALERDPAETKADPSVRRLKQALNDVETEIQGIKEEESRLQQAITTYQRKLEDTSLQDPQFPDLLRDYATTKDLYSSLLKRYADAQQTERWEVRQKGERFRVIDQALPPRLPAAPNRFRLLLMGLVLALGAALVAVVMAEQIDNTFHTVDDLRGFTKVPVLVSIPHIVTEADTVRRQQRCRLAAVAAMLCLALIMGASYYIAHGNVEMVRLLSRGQRS